jgi:hypothetical protein
VPVDEKARWMREAARVGWIEEAELDEFARGLTDAIQLYVNTIGWTSFSSKCIPIQL